jgi:hypothetical protein
MPGTVAPGREPRHGGESRLLITRVDTRSMDADDALLLLRAILADLPQLPGAACIRHHACTTI